MSVEVTKKKLLSGIQQGAMRNLAEGFKSPRHRIELYRETAQSIGTVIANAEDPMVREEGVKMLGSYANEKDYSWLFQPEMKAEIVDMIASIGERDPAREVKEASLKQVCLILDKEDPDGRIHRQAVEGIKRIASSVTVTDGEFSKADFINQALDALFSYANRRGDLNGTIIQKTQFEARNAISLIIATMSVATLDELKREELKP